MKNLRLEEASPNDLDQIRTLYWSLLDSSPKYAQILQWKKNIYPNDDDWNAYIAKARAFQQEARARSVTDGLHKGVSSIHAITNGWHSVHSPFE